MKIALMGRSLRPPLTGIGRHTLNLSRGLTSNGQDVTLYVTRETGALEAEAARRVVRAPFPTPHEVFRGVWEQTFVAAHVRRRRPDIYHSPNYAIPLTLACPSVLTVHDLAYLEPGLHNQRLRLYLRLFTDFSMKRASQVIAVSDFTRQQVIARYPEAAAKVSVVHNGLDPAFATAPAQADVVAFRERMGLIKPYVLFVGSIEPRKNLPRLVRAFEMAMERAKLPHSLVICGPWGWRFDASRQAIEESPLRERIRVLGYVAEADLPLAYAGADLLAYPSLQEGFGFPPLEAMACGTPALTSDAGSLPEVVGDAAAMAPATDVGALATAIERVLTDRTYADSLRAKGFERARSFTWERATEETLRVYARAGRGASAAAAAVAEAARG